MKRPVFRDRVTAALDGEIIFYAGEAKAREELQDLWRPSSKAHFPRELSEPLPEPRYSEESPLLAPKPQAQFQPRQAAVPSEVRPEPPKKWLFGFARSFSKAVDSIDRKLQGRILEAITDIATAPLATRGDTVKALSGEMTGFWRYRIGDFRLVYYPDEATGTITLYDFASRGTVYD